MENSPQQITAARQTIRQIVPLLQDAERKFKSARNWGFVDIFGGGLLSDLIKHGKLASASNDMSDISHLLGYLQGQLGNITIPTDYRMKLGGFSTFGDFMFDGVVFDVFMQSKIMKSLDEIRRLEARLQQLDCVLAKM